MPSSSLSPRRAAHSNIEIFIGIFKYSQKAPFYGAFLLILGKTAV
jgi:hypothetical protein